jgi:hypothetical protein
MLGQIDRDGRVFGRVQINGWQNSARHALVGVPRDYELILQCSHVYSLPGLIFDAITLGCTAILIDPSGGRGISPVWRDVRREIDAKVATDVRLGYAGGIRPDNVEYALETIDAAPSAWIDMESGVRTDDRFDLSKVRDVLEKVARWNERSST